MRRRFVSAWLERLGAMSVTVDSPLGRYASRGSALLGWVGRDAQYLARQMEGRRATFVLKGALPPASERRPSP